MTGPHEGLGLNKASTVSDCNLVVLFDSPYPYYGGGRETGIYYITREAAQRGIRMTLITKRARTPSAFFADATEWADIITVRSWSSKRRKLASIVSFLDDLAFPIRAYRKARALARTGKLDVVVTLSSGLCALAGSWLRRRNGVPFLINFRCFSSEELRRSRIHRPFYRWLRWVDEWNLEQCDGVMANGNDTLELVQSLVKTPEKVHAIFNGVDTSLFVPSPDRGAPRESGSDPLRLAFAASLRPLKGLHQLLNSVAEAVETKGCDLELHIAGKGDSLKYREQARRLGIENRVFFRGELGHEDLVSFLQACDVAVLPYLFGMGLAHSALEAMACGLPLLGYDVQDLRTVIKEGETGFLVPLGDEWALSQKIALLHGDRELVRRMGESARSVSSCFAWDIIAQRFLKRSLCAGDSRDSDEATSRRWANE